MRLLVRQGGHEGLSEGQLRNRDPKKVRESRVDFEGAEWAELRGQQCKGPLARQDLVPLRSCKVVGTSREEQCREHVVGKMHRNVAGDRLQRDLAGGPPTLDDSRCDGRPLGAFGWGVTCRDFCLKRLWLL